MTEYKSEVKKIAAPIGRVYEKLADLNNLKPIQEKLTNPETIKRAEPKMAERLSQEQVENIVKMMGSLSFDTDTVTTDTPLGPATLRIIDREPDKTIKFASEGLPMGGNMWIQLLPQGEDACAMRITLKADLNFLMRQMIGKKLEKGVDEFANLLASLPY